jgi:hypothetical protein
MLVSVFVETRRKRAILPLQAVGLRDECQSQVFNAAAMRNWPNHADLCQKECVEQAEDRCKQIPSGGMDEDVGALLVQSVTPLALEVACRCKAKSRNAWPKASTSASSSVAGPLRSGPSPLTLHAR